MEAIALTAGVSADSATKSVTLFGELGKDQRTRLAYSCVSVCIVQTQRVGHKQSLTGSDEWRAPDPGVRCLTVPCHTQAGGTS